MATAISKLNPSKLNDQKELLSDDIEIHKLTLFIRGRASADIAHLITSGSVERTIDGASTVTIEVNDPYLDFQRSGLLNKKADINIDGLFFRLASAERQGDSISCVFEDREVALLREHSGFAKANRDTMTRAEFVHSLVREVREVRIRFYCPQEHTKQPIAPDPSAGPLGVDLSRGGGFAPGADVKVKGINASAQQKKNIDTVLGVGASMGVPTVAQEAAVETVTVEASALNLKGGDRDSVGIFQQRNIPPWNKRDRRNVAAAARTFFEQALAYLDLSRHRGFHVSSWGLAQAVQISAFPDRYKTYHVEAERTVALWQGAGSNNQGSGSSGNTFLDSSSGGNDYEFTRGTMDQYGRVTRETTWDCAHRLADEVQWRCFMVSGTLYFIDDHYLMKSRPRMTFGPDYRDNGVDDLDFDYDKDKSNARVTITCEISRWGAPPGSVVLLQDLGPIDGRWLVSDIKRDLFSTNATIELIKALPQLPEPPPTTGQTTPDSLIVGPTSDQQQAIVQAAQRALAQKDRYRYRQYRPMANSLFDAFAYDHTDCSAFVTLCYKAGGAKDPNGFNYNGQGYTGTLWNRGTYVGMNNSDAQPADLAFWGTNLRRGHAITEHVALYIGGGMVIEFGSNPIQKNPVQGRSGFLGFRRYLGDGSSGH